MHAMDAGPHDVFLSHTFCSFQYAHCHLMCAVASYTLSGYGLWSQHMYSIRCYLRLCSIDRVQAWAPGAHCSAMDSM